MIQYIVGIGVFSSRSRAGEVARSTEKQVTLRVRCSCGAEDTVVSFAGGITFRRYDEEIAFLLEHYGCE